MGSDSEESVCDREARTDDINLRAQHWNSSLHRLDALCAKIALNNEKDTDFLIWKTLRNILRRVKPYGKEAICYMGLFAYFQMDSVTLDLLRKMGSTETVNGSLATLYEYSLINYDENVGIIVWRSKLLKIIRESNSVENLLKDSLNVFRKVVVNHFGFPSNCDYNTVAETVWRNSLEYNDLVIEFYTFGVRICKNIALGIAKTDNCVCSSQICKSQRYKILEETLEQFQEILGPTRLSSMQLMSFQILASVTINPKKFINLIKNYQFVLKKCLSPEFTDKYEKPLVTNIKFKRLLAISHDISEPIILFAKDNDEKISDQLVLLHRCWLNFGKANNCIFHWGYSLVMILKCFKEYKNVSKTFIHSEFKDFRILMTTTDVLELKIFNDLNSKYGYEAYKKSLFRMLKKFLWHGYELITDKIIDNNELLEELIVISYVVKDDFFKWITKFNKDSGGVVIFETLLFDSVTELGSKCEYGYHGSEITSAQEYKTFQEIWNLNKHEDEDCFKKCRVNLNLALKDLLANIVFQTQGLHFIPSCGFKFDGLEKYF